MDTRPMSNTKAIAVVTAASFEKIHRKITRDAQILRLLVEIKS